MNHNQLLVAAKQTKLSHAKEQALGLVLSSVILLAMGAWVLELATR